MSIQMNIGDHTSSQEGYMAIPNHHRAATSWARTRAKSIARTMPSADRYFIGLPGGRSLRSLLNDRTIWINFGPSLTVLGETNFAGGKEMAIGPGSYRIGRWTVLATLIHELAHVNGVRGAVSPRAAEGALVACGLGTRAEQTTGIDSPRTPYDPTIRG